VDSESAARDADLLDVAIEVHRDDCNGLIRPDVLHPASVLLDSLRNVAPLCCAHFEFRIPPTPLLWVDL